MGDGVHASRFTFQASSIKHQASSIRSTRFGQPGRVAFVCSGGLWYTTCMSDSDLTIRPATRNDTPALASLLGRVFAATYGAAIPAPILEAYLARCFSVEQLAIDLCDPDAIYLLAFCNGTLVGASVITASLPHGGSNHDERELSKLYVDEAFHGRGVATKLLQQSMKAARQRGYRALWLYVWERNQRALAFYRKHGFVAFGQGPVFVDHIRFDDILMRRDLDDH